METSFKQLDPLDNIFNKGIHSYDIRYEAFQTYEGLDERLALYHTKSDTRVDSITSIYGLINYISPIWLNHTVNQVEPQDMEFKDTIVGNEYHRYFSSMNTITLRDFIKGNQEEDYINRVPVTELNRQLVANNLH
jgi:hypothetical protein